MIISNYVMSVILVAVVLLVLVVALAFDRKRSRRRRQALGLAWLQSMALMLARVQQHRGLSNGFLNGSVELNHQIKPLQLRIQRDISDIESQDDWILSSRSWISLKSHWGSLSNDYSDKTAEDNLAEHNHLIQNFLYLIDDMAQAHGLLLLGEREQPLQLLWRELLTAAEYIGQARAMGTGISAQGRCDSVSRIRLNYLCEKINQHCDSVWRDLKLDHKHKVAVVKLLECVQQDILLERINIEPAAFFEIATSAIDTLLQQYQALVEHMQLSMGTKVA